MASWKRPHQNKAMHQNKDAKSAAAAVVVAVAPMVGDAPSQQQQQEQEQSKQQQQQQQQQVVPTPPESMHFAGDDHLQYCDSKALHPHSPMSSYCSTTVPSTPCADLPVARHRSYSGGQMLEEPEEDSDDEILKGWPLWSWSPTTSDQAVDGCQNTVMQ